MRVLLSSLNQIDGKYFYKNDLFSGVYFDVDDEKNVTAFEVIDGVVIKPYQSVCQPDNRRFRQVDITEDMTDYREFAQFKGQDYSGVGFEFDGEFCIAEVFIVDNSIFWEAQWTKQGIMFDYDVPNPFFLEGYRWYNNGKIKSMTITNDRVSGGNFSGSICFSENGDINKLIANNGFLGYTMKMINIQARFFPFKYVSDFKNYSWDENIILIGNDINDEFINMMIESECWNHVKRLTIRNTNVQNAKIFELESLKTLSIQTKNEDLAYHIRENNPGIFVMINVYD